MDSQLSCTSPFPCLWVFEILTGSNQVDASVLLDLVKNIPEPSDDICRNARELVSLRILESIYAQGAGSNSKSSSPSPKIRLDLSECCEDVLRRIIPETSSLNMKAAGAEMLRWDIQPFIAHKRSGLTNCSLQKLMDAILSSSHPPLASLRELSGLPVGYQPEHGAPVSNGDCNVSKPGLEGNVSITQSCAENSHSISHVLANGNCILHGNLPDENLLPAKRKIRGPTENAEIKFSKDQITLEDGQKTYKRSGKFKPDIISIEEDLSAKPVPSVIDLKIDASTRMLQCSEGERCSSEKETHVESTEQKRLPWKNYIECPSYMGLAVPDEVLPCDKLYHHVDTEVPVDKSNEKLVQDHSVKEVKDNARSLCEVKTVHIDAFVTNGLRNVPPVFEGEEHVYTPSYSNGHDGDRTDVAAKRNALLSFQWTASQDILATDERQLKLCVKCDKGDNLLFCSNSCPLMVHEKCLGCDASFDIQGKFYCPFCAYSLAMSKYMESKKKACLAKNDLAAFLGTGKELNEQQNNLKPGDLPGSNELRNSDFEKNKRLEHEQAGPSVLRSFDSGHFGGKKVDLTIEVPHNLNKDKQEMKRTGKVCQSPRIHRLHEMAVGISKSHSETISSQVPRLAEIRSKKGVSCQQDTYISRECNPISNPESTGAEDLCETESQNSGSSKYHTRVQKQESSQPSFPQLQRKRNRIQWTQAEEEKLKEGIQKICSPEDNIIPWKNILEFGAGTFHKNRTTVDLKDKWRNMMKAASKS